MGAILSAPWAGLMTGLSGRQQSLHRASDRDKASAVIGAKAGVSRRGSSVATHGPCGVAPCLWLWLKASAHSLGHMVAYRSASHKMMCWQVDETMRSIIIG